VNWLGTSPVNGGMIGAAGLRRRASAKINQAQNSTPVHPIDGVDNVAFVEGGDQALQRLRRIALARDIFAENGPCSLQRAQNCFLVVDKQDTHLVRARYILVAPKRTPVRFDATKKLR